MKLPSSEQSDFAATIGALLDRRDPLAPLRSRVGPRELDRVLWEELVTTGLLEPSAAGDVLTTCLVAQELGRRCAPLPYLSSVVAHALAARAGAAGLEGLVTHGLLDADGGWSTRLSLRSDGHVDGHLPAVPDGDVAELVVALAETGGGARLVVVRSSDARQVDLTSLDGTQPLSRWELEGAPAQVLPAPLGEDGLADVVALAHAVHGASLLGAMDWMLSTTVEYVGQRVQFGMSIASRQAVKQRCASMLMQTESARSMVLEVAAALEDRDAGSDATVRATRDLTVATGAAWWTTAAEDVAAGALQLHGGIGFTWEHDLHHYFKRCTVGGILLGTAEAHRGVVAGLLRAG